MNNIKHFVTPVVAGVAVLMALVVAVALIATPSEEPRTDSAPINTNDQQSLQRGAALFVNYCVSCHNASQMRYNRLTDIGLTEAQIKSNLMFTGGKIGDTMTVAMKGSDAKAWFGAQPPDLSLVARSRGADWIYTYLRSFYRDDTRPTGWNNLVFPKVGMPNVLWELQGVQELQAADKPAEGEGDAAEPTLKLVKAGALSKLKDGHADTHLYDQAAADLTNFLVFVSEPAQNLRHTIGYVVLLFLIFILVPLTYALKKEYWKDVK